MNITVLYVDTDSAMLLGTRVYPHSAGSPENQEMPEEGDAIRLAGSGDTIWLVKSLSLLSVRHGVLCVALIESAEAINRRVRSRLKTV